MNVEEFLTLRGADLTSTTKAIDRRFELTEDDLVLAVGSLVEGLGNSKSDVDVLLVRPERAGEEAGPVTVVVGRCLVDVRVLPAGEVSALLDRFESWCRSPWDVTHAAGFTVDDRTLLHRLQHGRRLYEGSDAVVAGRLPSVPDLARLKLHVARQHARTIQVDMTGNRDAGDHRSLAFAAQELLGQAVDALVAAYGLTNPLIKWRSRMLELLPMDWERSLTLRPTGLAAVDLVWRLHQLPRAADAGPVMRHAFMISTFARAVFAWAESVLLGWSAVAPLSWEHIGADDDAEPLPFLDFDVDFAPTPDGAVMGRLNEFGQALELSSGDLAVALLFDGRTSETNAALAVYGAGSGADPVARVVARAREAGLSTAPGSALAVEL